MRHKENLLPVIIHNEECYLDMAVSANTPIRNK